MAINKELSEFLSDLYIQYYDVLMHTARKRVNNESDVEDIVGLTFYIATLKADELYNHPNKIAWLYKALNLSIKKHMVSNTSRRLKSKENGKKTEEYIYHKFVSLESLDEIATTIDFEFDEDSLLDECKSILTPEEWKYIQLQYDYGYSIDRIAQKLGKTYSATTTFGNRIRKKLEKFFKERDKSN